MSNDGKGARRPLTIEKVMQIMPEVRRLLPGHRTIGQWTLAQICRHLADSFHGSMDGLDLSRHRIKRFFMAKQMLRHAIEHGIPRNYLVDPQLTPPPGLDLDDSVDALCEAIDRYVRHNGRLHAHPLFGRMDRPTWDRVHCIHSAHHLSFAIPDTTNASGRA